MYMHTHTHTQHKHTQGLISAATYVLQSTREALLATSSKYPDWPVLITGEDASWWCDSGRHIHVSTTSSMLTEVRSLKYAHCSTLTEVRSLKYAHCSTLTEVRSL